MLKLEISEKDFEIALGHDETNLLKTDRVETTLGTVQTNAVIDALPKVIADRLKRMIPSDYEVHEVELTVSLSGTPFGIGFGGEATIRFGPKAISRPVGAKP
jgi:hypothetical protein